MKKSKSTNKAKDKLDTSKSKLKSGDNINYDKLLISVGSSYSYFGNDDWSIYSHGLKNLNDALDIRDNILKAFEMAESEKDYDNGKLILETLYHDNGKKRSKRIIGSESYTYWDKFDGKEYNGKNGRGEDEKDGELKSEFEYAKTL